MGTFLKFFYEWMVTIFTKVGTFFAGLWNNFWSIFDFAKYGEILDFYKPDFTWLDWTMVILAYVLLAALVGLMLFGIFLLIRKYIRIRRSLIAQEEMLNQIDELNKKVLKLIREKDYIMAMQVAKLGIQPGDEVGGEVPEDAKTAQRFVKLIDIDTLYNGKPYETTDVQNFTLKQLASDIRNFACKELKLYYNPRIIRLFLAGMATSKIMILEGISGTGKTSLPYAMGKFFNFNTPIIPVQPSWRDKTELIGYLNEFTKRFNETDFLKSLYEYKYRNTIGLIVLDEMNLARIEYYFAEVLSTLEMPNPAEWVMDIVPDQWPTDPVLVKAGKLQFPTNVWFVGTANNDDSTFTITDKVYDRAIAIPINTKGVPFTPTEYTRYEVEEAHIVKMFQAAKLENPIPEDLIHRLNELDNFILSTFKITFGNRILKQIRDFVPVYVATGGSAVDGLDFLLTTKIFRKFTSLNLSYEQDNFKLALVVLDRLFGQENMQESKTFIKQLIKK